ISASTDILRDSYDETIEPREMLSRAEEKIFAILDEKGGGSGSISSINDIVHQSLLRIDARMKQDAQSGGVETGFVDFDRMCGGLHKSELIILAARPSMGKTALAMNMAENVAVNLKVPTLFVSLEMAAIELGDRL